MGIAITMTPESRQLNGSIVQQVTIANAAAAAARSRTTLKVFKTTLPGGDSLSSILEVIQDPLFQVHRKTAIKYSDNFTSTKSFNTHNGYFIQVFSSRPENSAIFAPHSLEYRHHQNPAAPMHQEEVSETPVRLLLADFTGHRHVRGKAADQQILPPVHCRHY